MCLSKINKHLKFRREGYHTKEVKILIVHKERKIGILYSKGLRGSCRINYTGAF